MSLEEIKSLLEQAAVDLFKSQPNLFDFTDESAQTEWNIAHHYAHGVHNLLLGYDYDVDIKKPGVKGKRPDIIFHKRSTHESNFLVIEVKRKEKDVPEEIEKIETLWFEAPLRYEYGAVVVISGLGVFQAVVMKNSSR